MKHSLTRMIELLSRPVLLHGALPLLMVLIVVGTVAQKYIGLYAATQIFFTDWVIWWGAVPLPGMPVILAVITLNLAVKLIFKSQWTLERSGTIITHMSVLLLLIGGLLTAIHAQEGYLDIARGEVKSHISDYHQRALVVLDEQGTMIWSVDPYTLRKGDVLTPMDGVQLAVQELCRNCAVSQRDAVEGGEAARDVYVGMARQMRLSPDALRHNDEENMTGASLRVSGADGGVLIGIVLENVPRPIRFEKNGADYSIVMRRARRDLPFAVELLDFTKTVHPGTDVASGYSSRVKITDQMAQWEGQISMNEPLRYKGYTLFQASYIEGQGAGQGDVSVLAVVRNAGRSFPYISGVALCVGVLVHLLVMRRRKRGGA